VIDLRQHPPRVVDNINVGQTPEGAAMSPDGNYVAITIQNGSARVKGSPAYNDHGLVKVFRINGTRLTLAGEAKVGGWGQGVVWSRNGRTLLAQSMHNKALDILSFNGIRLKVIGHLKVSGNPAGMRTAEH
jgi:DNA-binding beta-propeller fold protein YncE